MIDYDSPLFAAKVKVAQAVKATVSAEWQAEANPDYPHNAAMIEYADEQLDAALLSFARQASGGKP